MDKFYIGIDLGGTNLKTSLFNNSFIKIHEVRVPTKAILGSNYVINKIANTVSSLLTSHNLSSKDIICIGIGVPGILDVENGISKFSPNFYNWENVNIVKFIEGTLNIPTFIDNDVRVNLYGERYFGAGKDKDNIVLLTLGTGLGAGIIIDGHILYGATSSVGEIGHMNMYRNGRSCKCGSSGCLGRYVSALGMIQTLKDKLDRGEKSIISDWIDHDYNKITANMISKAFDLEDTVAISTLYETGELLGYGLVNVINMYNPEIIIIGGGMSKAGDRLLKKTREVIKNHALKISAEACSIVPAELGDSAGMIGAAFYAKCRYEKNLNY